MNQPCKIRSLVAWVLADSIPVDRSERVHLEFYAELQGSKEAYHQRISAACCLFSYFPVRLRMFVSKAFLLPKYLQTAYQSARSFFCLLLQTNCDKLEWSSSRTPQTDLCIRC